MQWFLCISRMPGSKQQKVKILPETHIPIEGEELQLLCSAGDKKKVERIREQFGDEQIIANPGFILHSLGA